MSESVNPEYWMNLDPPEPPIWEQIERYAKRNNDEYSAALLSIRARVESLEDDSNEHNASAHFVFEAIIRRLEALEANVKPTPNPSQIRTSLLATVSEAVCAIQFLQKPESIQFIETASRWLVECFSEGKKVLIAGNGGSLCDAMHFAEEIGRAHV